MHTVVSIPEIFIYQSRYALSKYIVYTLLGMHIPSKRVYSVLGLVSTIVPKLT